MKKVARLEDLLKQWLLVEGYGRRRYKADYIKHLIYAQSECDETIVHLDFLFETGSLKDKSEFDQLRVEYDLLSKRINKFIQWVEDNLDWQVEISQLQDTNKLADRRLETSDNYPQLPTTTSQTSPLLSAQLL